MTWLSAHRPRLSQSASDWARRDPSPCLGSKLPRPSRGSAEAGGRCGDGWVARRPATIRLVAPLLCAALALVAVALPALADEATSGVLPGGSFGAAAARSFGALALVLACVVALSYAGRRLLRRASGVAGGRQAIDIVASRSLGGRCSLTLVEVGGERILVGSTPQSLNLICKVGADDGHGAGSRQFDHLLRGEVTEGMRS